jgi:purine-cytosine permease-like protein
VVSVLGHSSMVFCQKIMIPTAGTCLIVGLFVYGTHFDSHYPGTGSYALGSLSAAWLLSALLCASTVASYGPYAGDWTRHISPELHPDGSILRALFLGGLFGMGGPFMWGVFTSVVLYANTIPDTDSSYVLALINAAPL